MFWCSVVPQASKPDATELAVAALQIGSFVANTLITTDVGIAGVKVLLINDLRTDKDCKALGVIEHVQHETISSCGSNVYTLAHRFEDWPFTSTVAPELVKSTYESPMFRLVAWRT